MNYDKKFILYENLHTKVISIESNNNYYKLGFETAFDVLTKEQQLLLNRLFNYADNFNSGYVDSIVWYSFLATSNIELPLIKEQYKYNNFDNIKDIDISVQRSGRNINSHLSKNDFTDNNLYQMKNTPLFQISNNENMNNDDFCMILQKTIYYKTDTEFLLGLLHSIFSTAKRYYLKKCNRCEKYYITNKTDNCYCNRKYEYNNKSISCSQISTILKKKNDYLDLNKKHQSFLRNLRKCKNINITDNYIKEYKDAYKEKVKEYVRTGNIVPLKDFINNYKELHPYN